MLFWIFVIAAGVVVGGLVLAYLDVLVFGVLVMMAVVSLGVVAWLASVSITRDVAWLLVAILLIGIAADRLWMRRQEAQHRVRAHDSAPAIVRETSHESTAGRPFGSVDNRGELYLVDEHGSAPLDARTRRTVIEALRFYRDNQLAFGKIPGQLDAMETTAVISQISSAKDGS